MSEKATLSFDGKQVELDVFEGTQGEKAVDISKLRAQTGLVTLDPGFKNTGSTTSEITFLDGEKGQLEYRGYSIEELTEKSTFVEVAYLLLFGSLPSAAQLERFSNDIKSEMLVHEDFHRIINGFPAKTHPMGILSASVAALTGFQDLAFDMSEDAQYENFVKLMAKMPTLAAYAHLHTKGHSFNYPSIDVDYTESFLKMLFDRPNKQAKFSQAAIDVIDKLLILHADHEQNCSTSTVRVVGSSHASLYASISSGINALWGPLHGGANQAVIEMLDTIIANGGDVEKYIAKAKDKSDPFRLMGFGHRVYRNFDPRSRIIKKYVDKVLNDLNVDDPAIHIATKLEEVALQDEYFVERKLYPNVDFYSGIIYRAMGIPQEMFTVLFAVGRLPGWMAQWKEMMANKEPIGRPRQIYTGETLRPYVDISKR